MRLPYQAKSAAAPQIECSFWRIAPAQRVEGAREVLRSRPRPRFLAGGVLEYWSIGVLRLRRIAPAQRAGDALSERARRLELPGVKTRLKPQAQSYSPFGTKVRQIPL